VGEVDSIAYVAFDTETNGLDASAGIISIALAAFSAEGKCVGLWQSLVKQESVGRTDIHGISLEMLADAPAFSEIYREFLDRTYGRVVIAHNADFDNRMIAQEVARIEGAPMPGWSMGCTLKISRRVIKSLPSYKLLNCRQAVGLGDYNAHDAADDAVAAGELFYELFTKWGAGRSLAEFIA